LKRPDLREFLKKEGVDPDNASQLDLLAKLGKKTSSDPYTIEVKQSS
jgi:hypothetical protein